MKGLNKMKNTKNSTKATNGSSKVSTPEEITVKIRQLIGGMLGISAKSIKVTPDYKLGRPVLTVPGLDKLSIDQKNAVAKADELLGLIISA